MGGKRDYYDILGVDRRASTDEIKRAYRRLALQYHPDRNRSPEAEEIFKEIAEAYEVLSDPEKRAAYDRFGHSGPLDIWGGFGEFRDPFEIFEEIFGFGTRPRTGRRAVAGEDRRYNLTISFEEAAFGTEKELEIERFELCDECAGSGAKPGTHPIRCPECNGSGQTRRVQQTILGSFVSVTTCPRCRGEGEVVSSPCDKCHGQRRVRVARRISVKIPAGVEDGMRIRLTGEGDAGMWGGPAGDLYVFLRVKPHRFFQRQNNDILVELVINVAQAALGDEVMVPTLDGDQPLVIPAGTQNGQVFRLKGKGVPYLRRGGRGDQLVSIRVATPTNLTDGQKRLFRELSKTLGREVIPQEPKGFFERVRDTFGV